MNDLARKRNIIGIGALLLIILVIPLTLYLTGRQQDLRQRAAELDNIQACYGKTVVNILVDKSLSMNNSNKMNVLRTALSQFVTSLGTSNKDIYVGMDVFGAPDNPPGGAHTELDFVKYADNKNLINNKINSLSVGVGGGTYLRKGFEITIAKIKRAKANSKFTGYNFVNVVFSDGVPEVSGHRGSQCSATASSKNGTICFAIAQDPRVALSKVDELKELTDKLYSVVIYSDNPGTRDYPLNSQLTQLMRDIADDPDSTYYFDAQTSNVNELNTIFQTIPQTICPVPTATPTQTSTPTPTNTPTPTPTPIPPTNTPIPQATIFNLTVFLHGIGNSGDSANPTEYSLSNKNPVHKTRPVKVEVFNNVDTLILTKEGTVAYAENTGNFLGTINMGTSLPSGIYIVRITSPQYLTKRVAGFLTISPGQTNNISAVTLVTGDVNNDNVLSILDYNILIGCYSDFGPAVSCNTDLKRFSDLTDDGNVDQFDYNLFLRDFSVQSGD